MPSNLRELIRKLLIDNITSDKLTVILTRGLSPRSLLAKDEMTDTHVPDLVSSNPLRLLVIHRFWVTK